MKAATVTLSGKYQVVIPKAARQKMGLKQAAGQRFTVKRVTKDEIVFKKDKSLDEYLGAYADSFPADAIAQLRQQRDSDWE